MQTTMKAIRVQAYGGPEQLRFEDAPAPVAGTGRVVGEMPGRTDGTKVTRGACGGPLARLPAVGGFC